MNPERMIKRRSFLVLLFMSMLWAVLLLRLWWIQLFRPHNFSKHHIHLNRNATKQRQQSIVIDSGRGDIYDRYGYMFTGLDQHALILFPFVRQEWANTEAKGLRQVAEIAGVPVQLLHELIMRAQEPFMLRDYAGQLVQLSEQQARRINELHIPGVIATVIRERYRQNGLAKHVIGFIHQNPQLIQQEYEQEWREGKISLNSEVGAAGLERSFDRFLQPVEPISLSYTVDGIGRPLRGLPAQITQKKNGYFPLSLKTTLDARLQERIETIADRAGLQRGSIVILEIANSDVLAMVSRPDYQQTSLNPTAGDWQNRALKQLPPGSVYKTVVAAAALAEGLIKPTDRFDCQGAYGKFGFSCWKQEGHGSLNLAQAYAQSCNIAFAEIAKRIGEKKLEQYAARLGVLTRVGWSTAAFFQHSHFRQFPGEEAGSLFHSSSLMADEGVLIQSAIGQRDVRMTPLQAANLMATIARGGKPAQVRIVQEILYQNQDRFFQFPLQPLAVEGIDPWTAYKLRRLLRLVVTEGTGAILNHLPWEVAGKSGTAQALEQGRMREHQWFVGFTPVQQPRYAIAVVAEDRPLSSRHLGIQLFVHVVEELIAQSAQSGSPLSATGYPYR